MLQTFILYLIQSNVKSHWNQNESNQAEMVYMILLEDATDHVFSNFYFNWSSLVSVTAIESRE